MPLIIQKLDKLDDTTSRMLEDHAIFDNDLKTIRLHQEDYEARLESMMVQQQRVVANMIQYLETVENRMTELEKRGGICNARPASRARPATGYCPGVVAEAGDDLEDSFRKSGAHGGSHSVGALWAATG